jgi:acetoin utilization protein AcuB
MRERIRKNPVTINPNASFFEAQNLIQEKGIRHLPVVDENNRLLGIVTESDIRKAGPSDVDMLSVKEAGYLLEKLKVSAFMTPKEKLVTITPDALIEEAAQLMHDHKIGCLPIVEGEKLYGIFTETDAMAHLVDVFGLEQRGTRLTIAIEDKPGMMFGILEIFKKHNVNVISMVSPSFMVEGKRIVATRIKTEEYEPIVKDLEKAGYPVLSVGKWPGIHMAGLKRILVPLDGSECAENVLSKVEELATELKATITLLRVAYAHTFPGTDPTEAEVKVVREAEEYLRRIEDRLKAKGFKVDSHVRYGNDAEEILDHAAQKDIDFIAMTTHGRSGVKRFLLGSVAEKLLRHSPKPIFLVRCT